MRLRLLTRSYVLLPRNSHELYPRCNLCYFRNRSLYYLTDARVICAPCMDANEKMYAHNDSASVAFTSGLGISIL